MCIFLFLPAYTHTRESKLYAVLSVRIDHTKIVVRFFIFFVLHVAERKKTSRTKTKSKVEKKKRKSVLLFRILLFVIFFFFFLSPATFSRRHTLAKNPARVLLLLCFFFCSYHCPRRAVETLRFSLCARSPLKRGSPVPAAWIYLSFSDFCYRAVFEEKERSETTEEKK